MTLGAKQHNIAPIDAIIPPKKVTVCMPKCSPRTPTTGPRKIEMITFLFDGGNN